MRKTRLTVACTLVVAAVATVLVYAGDFEPPHGPPAPTMKTLDEVQPRIPIHGDDLPFTITAPGSYYLAETVSTSGAGITIDSNDVTIDLMGFTLRGGTGDGIVAANSKRNIEIRNGTVAGWSGDGVDVGGNDAPGLRVTNARVLDVVAEGNGGDGIRVGDQAIVSRSLAQGNAGIGISVRATSVVSRSVSDQNGSHGIVVQTSVVRDCVAHWNGGHGIFSRGTCTVSHNTVYRNKLDGIYVDGHSLIFTNECNLNGYEGDGAGIHLAANNDSRVEGNNVVDNDRGIDVDTPGNIIVRNTASDNGTNYDIAPGNSHGPIVNLAGAGDMANVPGADHPWANFEY